MPRPQPFSDFDVITGPAASSRRLPPAVPPRPPEPAGLKPPAPAKADKSTP